ncbi:hypothetical protein B296_00038424 [Ensete ventricosum]|uniref:Uncharacterized protein n=1 Tax=Ensete ventricosum TaxID=4639 RepID=A0A426X0R6_ENSVE|nr:hypothetical protein B296_00038424 [Ensete ventricosum]
MVTRLARSARRHDELSHFLRKAEHQRALGSAEVRRQREPSGAEVVDHLRIKLVLMAGVGQELVVAAELRGKEMEGEVAKMQTELESLRSQRRELEQEVISCAPVWMGLGTTELAWRAMSSR